MAFAGDDIYIIGLNYTGETDNLVWNPCYWKNGVKYILPIPAGTDGYTSGITVNGNDVYITGYYYNDGTGTACYWKNGIRNDIGGANNTNAIAVSGNDVYIAGSFSDGSNAYACYWKNGNKINLSSIGDYWVAEGIALSGTDVYITGFYAYNNGGGMQGCYWLNGTRHDLSGNGLAAGTVAISGANVYMAGMYRNGENSNACYWLNGTQVVLPAPAGDSSAYTITIDGNDVYALGSYGGYDFGEDGPIPPPPCYWKNGVRYDLPAEIERASAIAVK
jgi:hypothetical protein